jgi:hypothetical protein
MQHGNGGPREAFHFVEGDWLMPGKHTSKEKREARHIEKGYEKKGVVAPRSRASRLGDGEQAGLASGG